LHAGAGLHRSGDRAPLSEMALPLRRSLDTPPSVSSLAAPLRPRPSLPEPGVRPG
jgi:hypothetical protein